MPTARRIHRLLSIEELEPRVAPTHLINGGVFNFTDASGDSVQVRFYGTGSVDFTDAGGQNPRNSDIATMLFSGPNQLTRLVVTDLNPHLGGDSITLGQVSATNGDRVGTISLTGASMSATQITLPILGNPPHSIP